MRRFYLTVATLAVLPVITIWPEIALGQHHGHGGHHHHGGGWGGGWGGSGFGRVGPFLPYSSLGYGYSSFSGFGGLNYYHGPVGGVYAGPFGYGAPYGYTSFGYPNYGPYYSYMPMAPLVIQTQPLTIGPGLGDNPAIQEWMPKNNGQPANPNEVAPPPQPRQQDVNVFVKPTTLEAKRKSIRYQAQGDEWFAKDNYLQAFARYKQAYSAAPDRPEPRFRMAVALAALNEYGPAVDELKRLVRMDPTWPSHGDRLDELFGEGHNLSRNAVLIRVSGWVREDVRDPDRLYLMGVLLHFSEDRDKAKTFFETASMLSGNPPHIRAYLTAPVAEAGPAVKPAPAPAPMPLEEEEEPAPVPKPLAKPAPKQPARKNPPPATPIVPKRELAGPKLLVPGEPVEDRPDGG